MIRLTMLKMSIHRMASQPSLERRRSSRVLELS